MTYDAAKDVYAIGDGLGGVTLVARPALQRALDRHYNRARTRDAEPSFLPGSPRKALRQLTEGAGDQELEEEDPPPSFEGAEVLAELPPPPEGKRYELKDDGRAWTLCLVDDDGIDTLTGNSTADRTYRHTLHTTSDSVLAAMNRNHRHHWSRDRTQDAKREQTLAVFTPAPDEQIRLEKQPNGRVLVTLVSDTDPEIFGRTPLGGAGDGPVIRSRASSGDRGYGIGTEAAKLAAMNQAAARFWNRR